MTEYVNDEDSIVQEESRPQRKWRRLEHKGVLFPVKYKSRGKNLIYKGRQIQLNDWQEEMCLYWVQSLGSEFHSNEHFKRNFSKEFLKSFDNPEAAFGLESGSKVDFDQIDFSHILGL